MSAADNNTTSQKPTDVPVQGQTPEKPRNLNLWDYDFDLYWNQFPVDCPTKG